jgi:DNA-binding response OmpR family regulator
MLQPAFTSNKHSILLIEDDLTLGPLYEALLSERGYSVVREMRGDRALERFLAEPFSLIIVDALLPGLSGFSVIQRIRSYEAGKTIPIIVISGIFTSQLNIDEVHRAFSISAYLTKPFDPSRLIDLVNYLMHHTAA